MLSGEMSRDDFLLAQLEVLAERLGITVRQENVLMEESSGTGGLCRIDGKHVLFLHAKATAREKVEIMAQALRGFDLSDIYVRPAVRDLLEKAER